MPLIIGSDKKYPKKIAAMIVAGKTAPTHERMANESMEGLEGPEGEGPDMSAEDARAAGESAMRQYMSDMSSGDAKAAFASYVRMHEFADIILEGMEPEGD